MKKVQAGREGGWKRYGKANTQTDRQTEIKLDRKMQRETDTDRGTHKHKKTDGCNDKKLCETI